MVISLNKEIKIRIQDPRIFLNEFFGYLSFSSGLITALLVILNREEIYQVSNQVMLASCALQNVPLLMVYLPQWRLLICTGILGIMVTNYFATLPIGNAFREGLFVGMIKVDYSYEALVKYHPEKYQHESEMLGKNRKESFFKSLLKYLNIVTKEILIRSGEMIEEVKKGNLKAFTTDAIRSQFFSSLMRIISATPLFIIAFYELLAYMDLFEKNPSYEFWAGVFTAISIRALAFSSFIDGLSKIAYGFMRESIMMRIGGSIFAFAQFYLMIMGEHSLKLVIPLSLAGLAAYPIVEGERLRKLALTSQL